jgi:hypothetical protein
MKVINYILSITLSILLLLFIEMRTPVGSFIFEFKEYTLTTWILQSMALLISIGLDIELGQWINNHLNQ